MDINIVDYLNECLTQATTFHQEQLTEVQASRDAYNGIIPSDANSSRYVSKDISRTVNGALPALVMPFATDTICEVRSENPFGKEGAKKQTKLINYQWAKKHDPLDIAEQLAFNTMVDGTAWLLSGWNNKGFATVKVVPFEAVLPDPSAYDMDTLRYIIYRRKVTISAILDNPLWFGKHSLEDLQTLQPASSSEYEPDYISGREDTYNPSDRSLEEVEVFEYYGYMDINDDGIAEPVLCIWSENKLLRSSESPYGDNPIPFDRSIYGIRPFSIYGEPINNIIGDQQRLKTSIMRGVIDNMSNANYSTKFIKKGALDPINFQRLMNQDPVVEVNSGKDAPMGNVIWDGNFNELPASIFKLLEDTTQEAENLSGVTRYATGSDPRTLNDTATGISIITSLSQQRLNFIVKHISSALRGVFLKWARFNSELVDKLTIPTTDGYMDVTGNELPSDEIGIEIITPTQGLKMKKQQDLTIAIQSLSPMIQFTGPEIVIDLLSKLLEEMDMKDVALKVRMAAQQQQQRASQDPMAQLEMQQKMAEIAKAYADTQSKGAKAQRDIAEAEQTQFETMIQALTGGVNG